MGETIYATPLGYELVEFLGEGLNSCVYRAIKKTERFGVSQSVAIKILKSEKLVDVWRNEVERLSAVRSRNCVGFLGWEIIYNKPALILEYVEGITLEDLCDGAKLSRPELDEILVQAAAGLADLNKSRLSHGDLNLHNIMIDVGGAVKLVDFGVVGEHGGLMTTPRFAAPSILAGEKPNHQTDIYSLRSIGVDIARKYNLQIVDSIDALISNEMAKNSLARKVKLILEQKVKRQGLTQKISDIRRVMKDFGYWVRVTMALGVFCVSLASRGDWLINYTKVEAMISIRTKNWLHINIDGRDLGYAPLDVFLTSNKQAELKWFSANGRGQTTLTPAAGQHIVLGDEDFLREKKDFINER
ncbi:MAG: hypothetical protein A2Z20_07985 [Bdellovibrionales bacterium RBG_16_40_8]|nr:MAG: hypothetical protein A2Z20_07985 [Bdellovibrionales bacterium RBG_16_40_8]